MDNLSIIVAVDEHGGFGKDGKIPWHFKEDFDHFKEVTKDSVCIMGRKTYEDMLQMVKDRRKKNKTKGKIKSILPGRECYVVSRDENYKAEGATAVTGIRQAIHLLQEEDTRDVFILGGWRMWIEAMPFVTTVHMTVIKGDPYDCDVFFPVESLEKFKISKGKETEDLYFITYTR